MLFIPKKLCTKQLRALFPKLREVTAVYGPYICPGLLMAFDDPVAFSGLLRQLAKLYMHRLPRREVGQDVLEVLQHAHLHIEEDPQVLITHVASRYVFEELGKVSLEDEESVLWGYQPVHTFLSYRAKILSLMTGKNIHILQPATKQWSALALKKKDEVYCVIGASPYGDAKTYNENTLYEMRLTGRGTSVSYPGPTNGRGVLVSDDDRTHGQIVDETMYIFLPSRSGDIIRSFQLLFDRCAAPLILAYTEGMSGYAVAATKKAFSQHLLTLQEKESTRVTQHIKSLDERIQEVEAWLSDLLQEKRTMVKLLQADFYATTYYTDETTHELWQALQAHPLVARVCVVKECIQLYTREISMLDVEGVCRKIGKYCISYSRVEPDVKVWAVYSYHPQGVPHPHISKEGAVCFGNITAELRSIVHEKMQALSVFQLVLQWLTEGYDPTLALHKIEEWPAFRKHTSGKGAVS
jgi:hypothetical protein